MSHQLTEPCPHNPNCAVRVCSDPRCSCRDHWHKRAEPPSGDPDSGKRGD